MKLKKITESVKLGLGMRKSTRIEVGDVEARREAFRAFSEKLAALDQFPADVVTTDIVVTGRLPQKGLCASWSHGLCPWRRNDCRLH